MKRRVGWAAGVLAVLCVVGLAWYLAAVGLDRADKLATVFGLFVALGGLAVTVWVVLSPKDDTAASATPTRAEGGTAGATHNTITGNVSGSTVIQARDITLGPPPPPATDDHR